MSQHDYVIDNQSAPAARADINAVLQAIATTNSGGTAPVATYANQIWLAKVFTGAVAPELVVAIACRTALISALAAGADWLSMT